MDVSWGTILTEGGIILISQQKEKSLYACDEQKAFRELPESKMMNISHIEGNNDF